MSTLQLLRELENYPMFTVNDMTKIINGSPKYIRTYLQRLQSKGYIHRIERGKYTLHQDPLVFASHLVYPSYISMWSALAIKGLTEQVLREVMVIHPVSKKPIKTDYYTISFTKSSFMFGFQKQQYLGFEVFIAETEKAILDALLYNKMPIDEVRKVIANTQLNIDKLKDHLRRIGNNSLIKRSAFLLEEANYQVDDLHDLIDYNFVKLDKSSTSSGVKNNKWRVLVNVD